MSSSANPYEHYNNPSVEDDDLIDPDDVTLDQLDDPLQPTTTRTPLTGNIAPANSQNAGPSSSYLTSRIPGEDRRAQANTIDETVWETLSRDLLAIWSKLREVLYPKYLFGGSMAENTPSLRSYVSSLRNRGLEGAQEDARQLVGRVADVDGLLAQGNMSEGLRDWDLWGPLVFCLMLSMLLSFCAKQDQRSAVFSGVFAMVWLGEAVVTWQIKLLGGTISFAQSVCIIGYTLFPIVIMALLSSLGLPVIVRIPVYLVLDAWAIAAGVSILGGSGVVKNRVGIAVYPLFLFYIGLGTLCFIS